MSGSGISWAICKSAPRSIQITMPAPHQSPLSFYRPDALPAAQPTASKHWRLQWEGFAEKESFKPGMKEWVVMDNESCESMELMEQVPLVGLGESELERLVCRWQREVGSWFRRWEEAYWKEWSIIRREDDVDGWASVTKDVERMLWRGWTVMRLCRHEGWVVVRTL